MEKKVPIDKIEYIIAALKRFNLDRQTERDMKILERCGAIVGEKRLVTLDIAKIAENLSLPEKIIAARLQPEQFSISARDTLSDLTLPIAQRQKNAFNTHARTGRGVGAKLSGRSANH